MLNKKIQKKKLFKVYRTKKTKWIFTKDNTIPLQVNAAQWAALVEVCVLIVLLVPW